jgi:hypothetical protein
MAPPLLWKDAQFNGIICFVADVRFDRSGRSYAHRVTLKPLYKSALLDVEYYERPRFNESGTKSTCQHV